MYHVRRLREDLQAFASAMILRRSLGLGDDFEALVQLFRGKLFGSFFFSGAFGLVGVALGSAAQYATGSPWVGLFSTVLIAQVACTVAYQVVWWIDNRNLYHAAARTPWARFVEMERDLLPVHKVGLQWALTFALVSVPLNSLLIVVASAISESFARALPMGVLVMAVDAVLVNGTFIRLMGDLFERHAMKLAEKYHPVLARA
jgi:hypothetical protein